MRGSEIFLHWAVHVLRCQVHSASLSGSYRLVYAPSGRRWESVGCQAQSLWSRIKDVELPETMSRAMARQAEGECERRVRSSTPRADLAPGAGFSVRAAPR